VGDVAKGVRDSWSSFVFRGKAVEPVVIGEGMEGIKDNDLSTQRRQDICTAMGIPESRLWSAAANYATRHEDEVAYFRGTIMPDCDVIQEALNEQVFNALHKLDGYRWEFQPEKLDVFKEDDTERATRLKLLVDAGTPLVMAYELVEWELTDEQIAELDKPEPEPVMVAPVAPVEDTQPETQPMNTQDAQASVRAMLKNWERKAIYTLKSQGKCNFEWTTDLLPFDQVDEIRAQLSNCVSSNDIKAVFYEVVIPDKLEDPLIILARELRLAREKIGEEVKYQAPTPPLTNNYFTIQPAPVTVTPQTPQNVTIDNVVNVPELRQPEINVKMAEQLPPIVTVNIPEQLPPIVNVTTTAPVVNVKSPDVIVNVPEHKPANMTVRRDNNGKISGIEEK
jgi:hypothetical protein